MPRWISVYYAARALGVQDATIKRRIKAGKLQVRGDTPAEREVLVEDSVADRADELRDKFLASMKASARSPRPAEQQSLVLRGDGHTAILTPLFQNGVLTASIHVVRTLEDTPQAEQAMRDRVERVTGEQDIAPSPLHPDRDRLEDDIESRSTKRG